MTQANGVPRWGFIDSGGFTREALLPGQAPSQYLSEERLLMSPQPRLTRLLLSLQ